jgi:hypothetical protein
MRSAEEAARFRDLALRANGGSFANKWAHDAEAKRLIRLFAMLSEDEALEFVRLVAPIPYEGFKS